MPTFTPNINLKKPLQTENYNVDDFNGNCDLIDAKIESINTEKSDILMAGTNISLTSDPVLKTVTVSVSGKVANSAQADNSTTLLGKTISNTIGNILGLIDIGGGVVGLPVIDGSKLTGIAMPDISGKVNLTDFTGVNQSKSSNGWQKLPGGLIIQWGTGLVNSSGDLVGIFPISFSANPFVVLGISGGNMHGVYGTSAVSPSGFTLPHYLTTTGTKSSGGFSTQWISIGI